MPKAVARMLVQWRVLHNFQVSNCLKSILGLPTWHGLIMSHPSGDSGAHAVDCRVVNILSCRNWMNQPWLVNLGGSPQTMIIGNSNANGYFT